MVIKIGKKKKIKLSNLLKNNNRNDITLQYSKFI